MTKICNERTPITQGRALWGYKFQILPSLPTKKIGLKANGQWKIVVVPTLEGQAISTSNFEQVLTTQVAS